MSGSVQAGYYTEHLIDTRLLEVKQRRAKALRNIRGLANVRRYSNQHCAAPESVLQHIGFCCMYAVYLISRLRENGIDPDGELLLRSAALHDAEESGTGDIVRNAKHFSPETKAAFDLLSEHAAEEILPCFGRLALETWKEAKAKHRVEGLAMSLIDLASVGEFIENEICVLGNRSFEYLIDEFLAYIKSYLDTEQIRSYPVLWEEAEMIHSNALRMKKARDKRNEER